MSSLAPFQGEVLSESISSGAVSVSSGAISIVSGSITVNSGTITIGSGIGAQMSGVAVSASGNIIKLPSGTALESGFGLSGTFGASTTAFDLSGLTWNAMSVVASGSETLAVGTTPYTKIRIGLSGIGFQASASGAAVNSGIPSLSGGVLLASGDVNTVILRNNPGNNVMYVGSTTERPASGFGFLLAGGDGLTLSVPNFNLIAVFAATSGQYISYLGQQF